MIAMPILYRLSALLTLVMLVPSVARSSPSTRHTSDYDYLKSRSVVARFYNWYCLRPATPTCSELESVRRLLLPRLYDDLCRDSSSDGGVGPQDSPSSVDPFSGGAKATSFRLRTSFVDADVAVVNVSLRSGALTLYVSVQLAFTPDGWVISELRHHKAERVVRRPSPARAAPPN